MWGNGGLMRLEQQQESSQGGWGAQEEFQIREGLLLFNVVMATFFLAWTISLLKDNRHGDLLFLPWIHALLTFCIYSTPWMSPDFCSPTVLSFHTHRTLIKEGLLAPLCRWSHWDSEINELAQRAPTRCSVQDSMVAGWKDKEEKH